MTILNLPSKACHVARPALNTVLGQSINHFIHTSEQMTKDPQTFQEITNQETKINGKLTSEEIEMIKE
jgi:hypothetical protein